MFNKQRISSNCQTIITVNTDMATPNMINFFVKPYALFDTLTNCPITHNNQQMFYTCT